MKIELEFPKATSDLTGNKLGRTVYEMQIEASIDEKGHLEAIIPETINDVGASFVQGIYAKLSEKYGKDKALELLEIKSLNGDTNNKISRVIDVYGV